MKAVSALLLLLGAKRVVQADVEVVRTGGVREIVNEVLLISRLIRHGNVLQQAHSSWTEERGIDNVVREWGAGNRVVNLNRGWIVRSVLKDRL